VLRRPMPTTFAEFRDGALYAGGSAIETSDSSSGAPASDAGNRALVDRHRRPNPQSALASTVSAPPLTWRIVSSRPGAVERRP
jgi:hypothetical protein